MECQYCNIKDIIRKDYKKHLAENMEDHFLSLIEIVEKLKSKLKI